MEQPKSKDLVAMLKRLVGESSALILLDATNWEVELSARNLPRAKTLHAGYLNVRDVLGFDRLVMPLSALRVIESYLGG
jgi:large subunit ribosomal protein L4